MATERQKQANQKNAQLSHGPVTIEGKRKSSLNALKLGIFARSGLLPGADEKEFLRFTRSIYADWMPVGGTEIELVEHLIAVLWRSRRFNTVDAGLYQMYG